MKRAERNTEIRARAEAMTSDYIQPRCGCSKRRGKWLLLKDLRAVQHRGRTLFELIEACRCTRCGAIWEWREVCAARALAGSKETGRCP